MDGMTPNSRAGNGRDARGRFTVGNPGGPGRPPRAVERHYLEISLASVTPEDWSTIMLVAVQEAKRGDATARAWLARLLVGEARLTERLRDLDEEAELEDLFHGGGEP